MKRFRTVFRYFLAALFLVVSGGIGFQFLQPLNPPFEAQEFLISLTSAGYIWQTASLVLLAAAILLCFRSTIGLALLLPIPLFINLVLYHLFLDRALLNAAPGIVVFGLHIIGIVLYRKRFTGLIKNTDD